MCNILFRGKYKTSWGYGLPAYDANTGEISCISIWNGSYVTIFPCIQSSITECTFQVDCNKRMIFEGDILKFNANERTGYDERFIVMRIGTCWCAKSKQFQYCLGEVVNHMVIVGNLWDTPDLLDITQS